MEEFQSFGFNVDDLEAAVERNEKIESHVISDLPTDHLRDSGPDYEADETEQSLGEPGVNSPQPVKIGAGIPKAIGEVEKEEKLQDSPETPKRLPDEIEEDEKGMVQIIVKLIDPRIRFKDLYP